MRCQTCGQPTSSRPSLCDGCRAERAKHGRVKAAARWTLMRSRLEKRRLADLDARITELETTRGRAS